jgi:hypothetical protein
MASDSSRYGTCHQEVKDIACTPVSSANLNQAGDSEQRRYGYFEGLEVSLEMKNCS